MADEASFIHTKSALQKKDAASSFQCVVYESRKRKKNDSSQKETSPKYHKAEMDMKKVRYEVFKFGMSGFNTQKKEEAKVALAVKLGAKPPKNLYHNYKELKVIKRKQQEEETEEKRILNAGKSTLIKSKKKRQQTVAKQKTKDSILDPYGKPGKVTVKAKRKKRHNL